MIRGIKFYKSQIQSIINMDKKVFTATRTVKKSDGYGGEVEEDISVVFEGRIYNRKSAEEIRGISGLVVMSTTSEKLLATSDQDIKKGDIFINEGRKIRVKFVNDYFNICKQCEMEVVEDGNN